MSRAPRRQVTAAVSRALGLQRSGWLVLPGVLGLAIAACQNAQSGDDGGVPSGTGASTTGASTAGGGEPGTSNGGSANAAGGQIGSGGQAGAAEGGAASGGAATGGEGGLASGGADTGEGGSSACGMDESDGACATCLRRHCCAEWPACEADADCRACSACLDAEADLGACVIMNLCDIAPAATSQLLLCGLEQCVSECGFD